MILRLSSGSATPRSAEKNRSAAFTWMKVDAELAAERLLDLVGLAGAHEAGVDEDAR